MQCCTQPALCLSQVTSTYAYSDSGLLLLLHALMLVFEYIRMTTLPHGKSREVTHASDICGKLMIVAGECGVGQEENSSGGSTVPLVRMGLGKENTRQFGGGGGRRGRRLIAGTTHPLVGVGGEEEGQRHHLVSCRGWDGEERVAAVYRASFWSGKGGIFTGLSIYL